MEEIKLNETQKDALQELANIGAGHASTVLSQMTNKDIRMSIPSVDIIPLHKTIDNVKDEECVVGVFLQISNKLPSYILLLISKDSAFALANLLTNKDPDSSKEALSEMDKSSILEISNIMMCSFFDGLTELLGIPIIPGPPALAYDMPTAVMDYLLIQMGEVANKVLIFSTDVKEENNSFKINMFLMPEPRSIKIILEKLGLYDVAGEEEDVISEL